MYLGSYVREVDAKGRFLFPAKLKAGLDAEKSDARREAGLVLTLGFEGCLYLFVKFRWEEFVRKEIESRSQLSKDARALRRILGASAQEADIDRQGRLLIPKTFLDGQLRLTKHSRRITVVGSMDHVEIWKEGEWNEFSQKMRRDFDDIAEKISRSAESRS